MSLPEPTEELSPGLPHRLCGRLHEAVLVLGVPAVVVAIAYGGTAMWALLFYLGVIQLALVLLTVSTALPPQEAALTFRSGWAAVAAGTDLLVLGALAWFLLRAWFDPGTAAVPAPTPSGFCAVFSVPVLGALHHVARDRAMRPVAAAPGRDARPGTDNAHN